MEQNISALSKLAVGDSAVISKLTCTGEMKRRMMDLGIVPGTKIKALHRSPCGDPVAYSVLGAVIALRSCDADEIITVKQPLP